MIDNTRTHSSYEKMIAAFDGKEVQVYVDALGVAYMQIKGVLTSIKAIYRFAVDGNVFIVPLDTQIFCTSDGSFLMKYRSNITVEIYPKKEIEEVD